MDQNTRPRQRGPMSLWPNRIQLSLDDRTLLQLKQIMQRRNLPLAHTIRDIIVAALDRGETGENAGAR